MKNENTSFAFLTAIIIAGVVLACGSASRSNAGSSGNSGLDALTAYVAESAAQSPGAIEQTNDSSDLLPAVDHAAQPPVSEQIPSA